MAKRSHFALSVADHLAHLLNSRQGAQGFHAHTNFVELTLYKLGYRNVITWVPKTAVFTDMPITTGVFQQQDQTFSLMYKLADMLAPLTDDAKRQSQRLVEGMPVRDWIVARLLEDTGQAGLAKVLRSYSRAGVWVDGKVDEVVPDAIKDMTNWLRHKAYSFLNAAIKSWAQSGARHEQLEGFDVDHSINPTHTLIAKDGTDHPLHTLAAHLAIDAVADVGRVMQNVWSGKTSVADVQRVAGSYFVHPADSSRFDAKVEAWARGDPEGLRIVSDREAMLERAKGHSHAHEHGEDDKTGPTPPAMPPNWNPLPPGMWTQWNYLTDHYAELTNTQDALPQRMG